MKTKGFTLIEVALFLAISGLFFAAIMVNISSTVSHRRYTDSLNDLVENLRSAYSATSNVENVRQKDEESSKYCTISSAYKTVGGSTTLVENSDSDNYPGRTNCAVYGQLVTFGEQNSSRVHRYDIIGLASVDNIDISGLDDTIDALKKVQANIVTIRPQKVSPSTCKVGLAGNMNTYDLRWGARIEDTTVDKNLYKGAIMIVRSPVSGTIRSFKYTGTGTLEIQQWLHDINNAYPDGSTCTSFAVRKDDLLMTALKNNLMKTSQTTEFCIGSDDLQSNELRRAIKISSSSGLYDSGAAYKGGMSETSVELLTEEDSRLKCPL
jgi:Tfp pilus assembly protein FimT